MSAAGRVHRTVRRVGLDEDAATAGGLVAADARYVFDESLIKALVQHPGVVLVDEDGTPAAIHAQGVAARRLASGEPIAAVAAEYRAMSAHELGSAYNQVGRASGRERV